MNWKTIRGKKMNKLDADMRRRIDFKHIHKKIVCVVQAEMKHILTTEPVTFPNSVAKWKVV